MEISYELNVKDYKAFVKYSYRRIKQRTRKKSLRFFLMIMASGVLIGLILGFLNIDFGVESIHLPTLVAALLVMAIALIFFLYDFSKFVPKPGGWVLGPRKMRLAEEGLKIESGLYEVKVKWDSIEDILQTNEHIFLFVDTIAAHIIPKRIFTTQKEAEDFLAELAKYVKEK